MNYFSSPSYERTEKIFLYRQLGMPLRKIGEKFDLSAEHIRRILFKRDRQVKAHKAAEKLESDTFLVHLLAPMYNPGKHAAKAAIALQVKLGGE